MTEQKGSISPQMSTMMVLKVLRIKDNDTNLKKPMKGGIPKDSQGQI